MKDKILTIALADDDEDDRMFFVEALEELALRVKVCLFKNGQELLDFLNLSNTEKPDLVFLDLNMPIKNGLECLREIRQNSKLRNVSIAIYSTSSSEKDIEDTFLNGANLYINKPNNFSKLLEALEKALKIDWQYNPPKLNRDTFLLGT
ncbi:response regulator [Pricia sp.]|uniref:response regulator n=1 Tax=Pricia sp. TaxID=2268138 RepID=UPI003594116E